MSVRQAAERAVIGSILTNPSCYDDVREWLEVEDFFGAPEQQAYAAIRDLYGRGQTPTPVAVDAELRETLIRGTQRADAAWLTDVMTWAPEPTRAATYGRMVLELSIRRHVADSAIRLRQVGENATETDQLNRVFATVDQLRRGVEHLHTRVAAANSSLSVSPPLPEHDLPRLLRPHRSEHHEAERDLILDLVQQPRALNDIIGWLRTSDFDDNEAGLLYGELTALHHARNPIDRLTLAWRAARVGIAGPICETLTDRAPLPPLVGDTVTTARRVLDQSVQAAVLATSDELDRLSTDPGTSATSHAYARLNSLWPQQRRMIRARLGLTE
ncbi:hypothetical protein KLP28_07850 [Nocardioidaceae bacterium]|nr:hypothetical protein KLP28_07850 [Nocardioidaceae bacterium]